MCDCEDWETIGELTLSYMNLIWMLQSFIYHDRPKPAKVPAQKHIKLNIV